MLGYYFYNFQILYRHTVATHLATHAGTFEHLGRVRTCTDRTGLTLTVVLTVRRLSDTAETMAFHYTLETFSFRRPYNIHIGGVIEQFHGERITEVQLLFET